MLVDSVTRENEYFNEAERGEQAVKTKVSYFVKDNAVTRMTSSRVSGINRHSNKRWYRWKRGQMDSVYKTKSGKLAGRSRSFDNHWDNSIPYCAGTDTKFQDLIVDRFGTLPTVTNCYPLASHYGIVRENVIPTALRNGLRQDSLRDMIDVTFGKSRYRRDLAKAVAKANPQAIAYAADFRGLVPIDWIVDFLRSNERRDDDRLDHYRIRSIRKPLLNIDPRSYRDLLNERFNAATMMYTNDIKKAPIVPGRYRSLREMHDRFFDAYRMERRAGIERVGTRVYEPPKPRNIPQIDVAKKIDGLVAGDFVIKTAKITSELEEWGNEMRNCIGSYSHYVARDGAAQVLGGVYRGDRLIANFEIDNGTLKQLLGKTNSTLPVEDRQVLELALADKQIKVGSYWGSSGEINTFF